MSREARIQAGVLLRLVQEGEHLSIPHARAMPTVWPRCHELRLSDRDQAWRVVYRVDADAVVVLLEVFTKKSCTTPDDVVRTCRRRLSAYDAAVKGAGRMKKGKQTRLEAAGWRVGTVGAFRG